MGSRLLFNQPFPFSKRHTPICTSTNRAILSILANKLTDVWKDLTKEGQLTQNLLLITKGYKLGVGVIS